ncbi:MAG: anthranilate phosphoribosyltransferase [Firmicutes bacterium]|nr:anthranilate phosphoribosyltransferase [Bacillota bacterium]MBU4532437.1 anthranilate phosphoribosyltransferase [Bacillota bacterium]MBV1727828.1 anthranilate phosphoribosyltransferase [Desulforudis sp.]MBV1735608.1 anthranilate phosphoribosyltransferase [Desulforudis sp.]MDQ7788428.1 anthranilate phosphoribosyltransferase [Clostridia bacterium]
MIQQAIQNAVSGNHLSSVAAEEVMTEIMSGGATPAQVGAFLTALRLKGETEDEVAGFVRAMRRKATPVRCGHPLLLDTCGTGGDGAHTFNISTTAAFVVAAAGVPVAKHGNVSVSSKCGSADLLREAGANLELTPEQIGRCLDQVGIAFLFAPRLHSAMRFVAAPRREIGIRTVFNILGPLTNPANPQVQVIGVYSAQVGELVARTLCQLEIQRAFVVYGAGGLDELSLAGPNTVWDVRSGTVSRATIDPADLGLEYVPVEALIGGSPEENLVITRRVLDGGRGVPRNAVALNAALALVASETAGNLAEGYRLSLDVLNSGAAQRKFESFIDFTRKQADA